MKSIYKSHKRELAIAKMEHKISKINDPVLFEERRANLASMILSHKTPNWGGLKFTYAN